jgi:hypothetical protein
VDFQQSRGLTMQSGKSDIALRLQQRTPGENEPGEAGRGRLGNGRHVNDDHTRPARGCNEGYAGSFLVAQPFGRANDNGF